MNNTDCLIPLTQGKFAIVSYEDFEWVMQWKWFAQKMPLAHGYSWYAIRRGPGPEKRHIPMHREIAIRSGLPESRIYDHINHYGLDNRRENLRPCTFSQNTQNSQKRFNTSSKFKGVSWHKRSQKWRGQIKVNGKRIHLGDFKNESDAATAYDDSARIHFGEFACTNFTTRVG